MTGLVIRPATAADRDAILPMARELATSFEVRPGAFTEAFGGILADPHTHLLVAEEKLRLLGYLLGFRHATFYANGPVGWIEEVFVAADAREKGAGSALVAEFEAWARMQDCALVALATRRAEDFYTAIGYERSATYLRKVF